MIEDPVVNKNLLYAKNGYRLHLNVIIFTQNRKIITFNSKNRAEQTKKQKNKKTKKQKNKKTQSEINEAANLLLTPPTQTR